MALPGWEVVGEGVAPEAAIEFWRAKACMTQEQAMLLAEGERWRAFWVAGLTRHDEIQCVYDAIGKALEQGDTLAVFKQNIASVMEKHGWHNRRVETIFRTNMQTAYMAGRYKRMQEVKASRPYWQYLAVMDKRVRPSHAILHEKVYPADHEFWSSNYPPNGFRCRCTVITLSERQVRAQGLTVEKDMPKPGLWTDPKTGMEYHVHFPGADKGFRNNPGKEWMDSLLKASVDKLEKAHPRVAVATVWALVQGGFAYWSRQPSGCFPLAVLTQEDAASIGSLVRVAVLSAETCAKQQRHHPELTAEDYALAQEAVEHGEKIQQDERNLAFVLHRPGGVVVIVKATRQGDELYVTSLYKLSGKDVKRNEELARLRRRRK